MRALFILVLLTTRATAADWQKLTVHGNTIAATWNAGVRVSLNGGGTFESFPLDGPRALAATSSAVFVASAEGVSRITREGLQPVAIPAAAKAVRSMRAGPDWLMLISDVDRPGLAYEEDGEHMRVGIFVHQGDRWQQLFADLASPSKNAMTTLLVGPNGHAMASLIYTAGCGGVDIAGGGFWRPGRAAQSLHRDHRTWELPASMHRDWFLGYCPEDSAECDGDCAQSRHCLYDPARTAQPTPDRDAIAQAMRLSPDARWVAISTDEAVFVHARTAGGIVETHRINGRVIAARNNGITVRTSADALVRVGKTRVQLGAVPQEARALDIDRQGRLYALTAGALLTSTGRGWTPVRGF